MLNPEFFFRRSEYRAVLLQTIQNAFRQNLKPAFALQTLALAIVLLYYLVPATAPAFAFFADLKTSYGMRYTIVSTALFGGLLPFLYLWFAGRITRRPMAQFVFYILIWAWQGASVDLLYSYQGEWFGQGNDAMTLAKKVAFDQFIYSVFYRQICQQFCCKTKVPWQRIRSCSKVTPRRQSSPARYKKKPTIHFAVGSAAERT